MGVIPVIAAWHCADNPALTVIQPLDQMTFAGFPRADTYLSGPGDQVSFSSHADQGWSRWVVVGLGISSRWVLSYKTNEGISRELPAKVAMTGSPVVLQGQIAVHSVRQHITGIDVSPRFRSYSQFFSRLEVISVSLVAVIELIRIVEDELSASEECHNRRSIGGGQ